MGDFNITAGEEIKCVFERKTMADLLNSFKDGRIFHQLDNFRALDAGVQKYILVQGSVCEFDQQKYNWIMEQAKRIGISLLWVNSIEQTASIYSSALRAFATRPGPSDEVISISSSQSDSFSVISDNMQENTFTTLADLLSSNSSSKLPKTRKTNASFT